MSIPSPIGDHTKEASISIEGTPLSFAQSMTVRVGLEIFAMTLTEQLTVEGDDPTAKGYLSRLAELRALIGRGAR